MIDDDTPTPHHACDCNSAAAIIWLAGIGIGLLAWLLIVSLSGYRTPLVGMSWFFAKAALMTFGGAYTVLPYVFDGAVDSHQ